jgi:Right handed beta helix region
MTKFQFTMLISISMVFFLSISVFGATLHVPSAFPTIQSAINASMPGDCVLVADGVYSGNGNTGLWFYDITVASENGPGSCIIDCKGLSHGFDVMDNAVLSGFTIRNAYHEWTFNGAVNCGGSNPAVNNCILTDSVNLAGICCMDADGAVITNCLIHNNMSSGFLSSISSTTLVNCTIAQNDNYGAYIVDFSDATMKNCIVHGNVLGSVVENLESYVFYTSSWIGKDPLFVTGPNGAFYLSQRAAGDPADSPCVDTGYTDASMICLQDACQDVCLDEFTTRRDLVADAGTVDMGFHYPPNSQTPPPPPQKVNLDLILSGEMFEAGDNFKLRVQCDEYPVQVTVDLFVVLQIENQFWFWPRWNNMPHSDPVTLQPGVMNEFVILDFNWPEDDLGHADGLAFWSVMLEGGSNDLLSNLDSVTFGYR